VLIGSYLVYYLVLGVVDSFFATIA
jgi:hypothetical protein